VMRVKPLKTLLEQADAFCHGSDMSKTASAQESSVLALADLLSGASADVTIDYDSEAIKQTEIDKIAESLNRVQTASEIDMVLKLADFEKKAEAEGFTKEQISEAMSKIAAEKIAQSIPLLVATGMIPLTGKEENRNVLPKKPVKNDKDKSQRKLLGRLSLTKVMGY
jgi:hypothetical protein